MEIIRLQSVTDAQIGEILALMRELDPEIAVTPEMVRRAVEAPGTHFFAMLDSGRPAGRDVGGGPRIVGCASLCVTASPTGCKAHIEDVVVLSSYRGRQLGRRLMEHVLDCNQAADFKRLVRATRAADYDFCIEYHGKCGQFARETMEKK